MGFSLGDNSLSEDTSVQHHTSTTKQLDNSSVLHNAAYVVNDLIHEEISRQSTTIKHHSLSLDIDNELENMNPLLLEFVNSMTATVRERKHPALKNENDTIAVYCGNQRHSYHGTTCCTAQFFAYGLP